MINPTSSITIVYTTPRVSELDNVRFVPLLDRSLHPQSSDTLSNNCRMELKYDSDTQGKRLWYIINIKHYASPSLEV